MSEDPRPGVGEAAGAGAAPVGPPPPPAAGDEMIGRILVGRYRIVRLLGEGAQSTVYVGEHQAIGRLDAIKVLRRELAGDREAVGRLTRGARNVSAIRHPNVCTVYDYSTTEDGLPFLAMELVEGESLKEILERDGRLPPERALGIAAQIADALEAAHDAGIVHRDLKPGNVMVARGRNGADQVKVVDFDIAKATSEGEGEVTRLGYVVGTPEYMSPEQLMGETLDGRSDLYSLGLVLVRTLTGALPFRTPVLQDLLIERLTQPPLTLRDVAPEASFPAGLQELLDRALQRKAADRIATAAEFAGELRRLGGAPVGAPTPATAVLPAAGAAATIAATRVAPAIPRAEAAAPATPGGGGRRLAVASAVVVVLAAIGLGAWALLRPAAPPAPGTAAIPSGEPARTTTPPEPAGAADAGAAGAPAASPIAGGGAAATPTAPSSGGGTVAARPGSGDVAVADRSGSPAARPGGAATERAAAIADPVGLLGRLFDRVGPPYPERASLEAIYDSARALWPIQSLGPARRGEAAYVAGVAAAGLGEPAQCVRWVSRALTLKPDSRGYRVMLDNCRNGAP